jgi:hypothetical protein
MNMMLKKHSMETFVDAPVIDQFWMQHNHSAPKQEAVAIPRQMVEVDVAWKTVPKVDAARVARRTYL